MSNTAIVTVVAVILVVWLLGRSIRTVRPTSRGLIERFGKYNRFASPGIIFLIPFIEQLIEVDLSALRRVGGWLQKYRPVAKRVDVPSLVEEFSGTIRENVCYGRLDAPDADVQAAAQAVGAHEFIMDLEQGYDTLVGEGGAILSGGQRQLISFARALLADPRILILDEATSSVDTQTERVIQAALERLFKDRTSFVIAHRLSTITRADKIVVLDQGRVVEEGTHAELLEKRGRYFKLYTMAFMERGT